MYMGMLHATNSLEPGHSNGINAGQYIGGFGLITFDLSRSHLFGVSRIIDTPRMSDLQVHMDLRTGLEEATSFIFILVMRAPSVYNAQISIYFAGVRREHLCAI